MSAQSGNAVTLDFSESGGCNLILLLIAAFTFSIQSVEEIKNQKEQLQGVWSQTGGSYKDADFSTGLYKGHTLPKSKLRVAGDRWTIEIPSPGKKKPDRVKGIYILYPNGEPKRIDLKINGMTAYGIYKLNEDKLTLCYGMVGKTERPSNFDSCVPDGFALMIYKRVE